MLHDDVQLGSGFSAVVKLATPLQPHPGDPSHFACKVIDKRGLNVDLVKFHDEVAVLRSLHHPHIVRLYDVYETPTHVYLVTQMCEGGELFDRILARGAHTHTEAEAAVLLAQLLDALVYLHARGIVHRDLKPENLLFLRAAPPPSPGPGAQWGGSLFDHLLVSDFGFAANTLTKPRALRASSKLGSLGYSAPEVFSGESYTEACDVWSVGVILYILLAGVPPFVEEREDMQDPFWLYVNEMTERPGRPLQLEGKRWEGRSDEVKALLKGMLEVDPAQRLRAADAMDHPWVKEGRERWEAVQDWWMRKDAQGGEVLGGWTVRERGKTQAKGDAAQMQSMKEVMREIETRRGADTEGVEGKGKGKGEETKETMTDATVLPAGKQRRVKVIKAMSVMMGRH